MYYIFFNETVMKNYNISNHMTKSVHLTYITIQKLNILRSSIRYICPYRSKTNEDNE